MEAFSQKLQRLYLPVRLLLILGPIGYSIYEWITQTGLYRLLAEAQWALFEGYDPLNTGIVTLALWLLPGIALLWILSSLNILVNRDWSPHETPRLDAFIYANYPYILGVAAGLSFAGIGVYELFKEYHDALPTSVETEPVRTSSIFLTAGALLGGGILLATFIHRRIERSKLQRALETPLGDGTAPLTLPIEAIRWPAYCIKTKAPASTTFPFSARKGIDFLIFLDAVEIELHPPATPAAKRRYLTLKTLFHALVFCMLLGVIVGVTLLSTPLNLDTGVLIAIILPLVLPIMVWERVGGATRFFNRLYLGIRARPLGDGTWVQLTLRDEQLDADLRRLNREIVSKE